MIGNNNQIYSLIVKNSIKQQDIKKLLSNKRKIIKQKKGNKQKKTYSRRMDKNVLVNVQKEKIKETQIHLIEWMSIKEAFLKQHIPIQHTLMKSLDHAAEITLLRLRQTVSILKQQRQLQHIMIQKQHKNPLTDSKRFPDHINTQTSKLSNKNQGQTQQSQPQPIWTSNFDKSFACLSKSLKQRILNSQAFIKVISKCEEDIIKQQTRYSGQLKKHIKILQKQLQKIDLSQKQQQSLVSNIKKQSKNKDRDGNFYLLQYKTLQILIKSQIDSFAQRGKDIFNFMKTILDSQKACSKKLRQILDCYVKAKNTIYKQNQFDQRFLGVLVVMEDNIVQSRKQYFNNFLLSEDQIEIIKTLVPQANMNGAVPNLQTIVRYLKLESQEFLQKLNTKSKWQFFASNLCYKKWEKTFLARGWLITSYVPVTIYLTYDGFLSMINVQDNELVQKVNTKMARVNRVENGNVVFLEEIIKGFFSDGKEEYQIKFENFDSLEEFTVFIGTGE